MLRALVLTLVLLATAPAAGADPCATRGLTDFELATTADAAFVGRLVRVEAAGERLTYRVLRPLTGRLRKGQRVVVRRSCPVRPDGADHLVFVDPRRVAIEGRAGVQPAVPGRVAALFEVAGAKGPDALVARLAARYQQHHDPAALAALIDAPALLARLDPAARDALVREIGRSAWTAVEAAALARLERPLGMGLLTLADARCQDAAFDTPCGRAIPAALAYARGAAGATTRPALAACLRGAGCPEPLERLRALARCEEQRGARWDAGPEAPAGFTARLTAGAALQVGWAEAAAAWCEAD